MSSRRRLLEVSTGFWEKLRGAGRVRAKGTIPPSYFEAKYRADIDPWGFRTSQYEQQKYQATIDALSRRRYQRALELGCGIGILSAKLAARCDRLLALDASETAIAEANRQNLANVDFDAACLPTDFPTGHFDLIVLSEFLYYFSATDLKVVAQRCVDALDQRGEMILCHWLGDTDNPLTGREASDLFAAFASARLPVRTTLNERGYRLERLSG
jgi:SAM-dependent methyltransferase